MIRKTIRTIAITVLLSVVDLAAYLCLLSAKAERSSLERGMRESARASSPR